MKSDNFIIQVNTSDIIFDVEISLDDDEKKMIKTRISDGRLSYDAAKDMATRLVDMIIQQYWTGNAIHSLHYYISNTGPTMFVRFTGRMFLNELTTVGNEFGLYPESITYHDVIHENVFRDMSWVTFRPLPSENKVKGD